MKTTKLHVSLCHLHGFTALLNKTSAALLQAITGKNHLIRQTCLALLTIGVLFATCWTASATSYYCDPTTGTSSNPGTSASPWGALDAALTAHTSILVGGDVIYLRSGYHGVPALNGTMSGAGVTITPDTGATPKFKTMSANTGQNWIVDGLGRLDICPANLAPGTYVQGVIVSLGGGTKNITIKNCTIEGAPSIAGWTQNDWYTNLGYGQIGINSGCVNLTLSNNTFTNHAFPIVILKSGSGSLVSGNTIENFMADGIRGLADNCTFSYNTVLNSYVDDYASNHDDFFQSWSLGLPGGNTVGTGTVSNVSLIGNIFICQTDPNQPLPPNISGIDGIGNFDGMFAGWLVENNLISSYTWNGLVFYGAINCTVVNNTVVENPYATGTSGVTPIVCLYSHKPLGSGTAWPVVNSGNIVRNNIATRGSYGDGSVLDHNLVPTWATYSTYFTDFNNLDFTTASGTAPQVNSGTTTVATIDIEGRTRTVPYDVGAYEYFGPMVYEGFNSGTTNNISTIACSPGDVGLTGTTWSGTTNDKVISPGLTYTGLNSVGNTLQFTSNTPASRAINMSAMPAGYTQVDTDSVTRLGIPGTTLWFRFLIRTDAADAGGTQTAGLELDGATSGGTMKMRIGITGTSGSNCWAVSRGTTPTAVSSIPIVTGSTVLLVVRVQYVAGSNNDQVDLFVNPPIGANPPGTPSATLRNLDVSDFDTVQFKGMRQSSADEFAIAKDWTSLW